MALFQWNLVLLVILLSTIQGCTAIKYYSQSATGHLKVWWAAEPIDELISDKKVDEKTELKLKTALEIRKFASEKLQLPDNASYRYYVDIGRESIVWNIFAAPEFSVDPHRWCYFIVGCVGYRGYFDENEAHIEAAKLAEQNYDVYIGGVAAYSTLGWFSDPLLNTMISWQDRSIASLIFHELAHQVIYIQGDADFNEAFATAVEQIGTIYWLNETRPELQNDYVEIINQQRSFRKLLLNTRSQLVELYKTKSLSQEEMRIQKKAIIDALLKRYSVEKRSWFKPNSYDGWFEKPINNARLSATMAYLERVPAFFALFLDSNSNWDEFYKAVKKLDKLDKDARQKIVENLLHRDVTLKDIQSHIKNPQSRIDNILNKIAHAFD